MNIFDGLSYLLLFRHSVSSWAVLKLFSASTVNELLTDCRFIAKRMHLNESRAAFFSGMPYSKNSLFSRSFIHSCVFLYSVTFWVCFVRVCGCMGCAWNRQVNVYLFIYLFIHSFIHSFIHLALLTWCVFCVSGMVQWLERGNWEHVLDSDDEGDDTDQ